MELIQEKLGGEGKGLFMLSLDVEGVVQRRGEQEAERIVGTRFFSFYLL